MTTKICWPMSSLPRLLLFSITLMCKRAKHHYKSTPLRPFTSGQKYCGMLCRSGFVSFLLGSDLHLETISQLVETVGFPAADVSEHDTSHRPSDLVSKRL